jgi:hypothetical protein
MLTGSFIRVPGTRRNFITAEPGFRCNHRKTPALIRGQQIEQVHMKKTLAVLAMVATVAATAVTAPAQARGRGIGPGLAFGLAAGAIAASAYPYVYGPGYGYYDDGYYGPGPYAYYGGPYWRHW